MERDNAFTSPGVTSNPSMPSRTSSGTLATRVAMQGTPMAMASSRTLGSPSRTEDNTATEAVSEEIQTLLGERA